MIDVRSLFRPLDEKLISLLKELKSDDWEKPSVAGTWRVKDVAAHLLDGNLRTLSMQRDHYFGEKPPQIDGYQDLVSWLNQLNHDWVKAMNRLSPAVIVLLHEASGPPTCDYYTSLELDDEAIFSVDWAGESKSYNWMHLAREYTEKWHHQQQIRDAVGVEGIMTEQFYPSFIDTYMRGLPNAFRQLDSPEGTAVCVQVTSNLGGCWFLIRKNGQWKLSEAEHKDVQASVSMSPELAWKLFSKNIRPQEIKGQVESSGSTLLVNHVLEMVSVMA